MSDRDKLPESGSSSNFYHHFFSNPVVTLDDKSAMNHNTVVGADYSESFYGPNPPKMLCFGDYKTDADETSLICSEITATTYNKQKNPLSQSDSSSASSGNNSAKSAPNSRRKRIGPGQKPVNGSVDATGAPAESKKAKSEKPAGHAKPRSRPVRKEKIGERIATLQHLVSPFGKTDTASVLHETMSYIKFLQEQIQVLCSPYLQTNPVQGRGGAVGGGLKNRGLCLVPVSSTVHVESTNGADIWSPAAAASINDNNNGFNVAQNKH